MNADRNPLDDWLAAARDGSGAPRPPAWLEAQLLARFDERCALQALAASRRAAAVQRRERHWRWPWALPAAALGLVVLATALAALMPAGTSAPADRLPPAFVALAPLEAIAAERGAVLVPGEVARAQLADYGLPVDPARADQPARAEFLLSASGTVLAVRFLE